MRTYNNKDMKYYHTEIQWYWDRSIYYSSCYWAWKLTVLSHWSIVLLRYVQFIWSRAPFIVAGAGLANLQYYHIKMLCCFLMCSRIGSEHLLQLLLRALELTVLKLWNIITLKFNCIEVRAFVLVASDVLESEHLLQLLLQGIETSSIIIRKIFHIAIQ